MSYSQWIQNRIDNIEASDKLAFASAFRLGPWIVPLPGAIIFGYSVYVSAPVDMAQFKLVASLTAAAGIIIAGVSTSHIAIRRGGGSWSLVCAYVLAEIIGLWVMSLPTDMKVVGTLMALLSFAMYVSRALHSTDEEAKEEVKADREAERAEESAEKAWQRQLELKRLEMEQQEKLAKIEASKEKAIARASVPNVSSGTAHNGDSATKTSVQEQEERILGILAQEPDTPMAQVAQSVGTSRRTVYRRLDSLQEQGKVYKNGEGWKVK